MKTIVIYDNEGQILLIQSGTYTIPKGGVQYIEIDNIPEGKYIAGMDVKKHKPVFADMEKSETDVLKEQIETLKNDIADLTLQMIMEE